MKKKKISLSTIGLAVLFLVGLSVMLYPTVSDWWNRKVSSRAVANYKEMVDNTSAEKLAKMLDDAADYNRRLLMLDYPLVDYARVEGYEDTLDITGTGIMGYVTIPSVNIELPIFHGTSKGVLNTAAGHLQGTTLPVGGIGNHAVISAHRGLPSARLFTDIDKIVEGDTFTITVLDQIYTYEVEQILIVLPSETENIMPVADKDYVTLMTCTPYGINTHRLLLRGHRIASVYDSVGAKVSADAVQVDPMLVVPVIAAPLVIGLLVYWFKRKDYTSPTARTL